MRDTVLFTSDCYSEDRNATLIGLQLRKLFEANKLDMKIAGASLVSESNEYQKAGFEVIASAYVPPSGGFSFQTVKGFFSDLFSGGFLIPIRFIKKIRAQRDRIKLAIVVGDVFLLWLTRKALKKTGIPILFYIHSKSDYIEPHYKIEERFIRKAASDVFARDELTAGNMRGQNIPSVFLGSVIMDELNPAPIDLKLDPSRPTIGLMPGTRGEALENFMLILQAAELLYSRRKVNFTSAVVGQITDTDLAARALREGWTLEKGDPFSFLVKGECRVQIGRGVFVNVVHESPVLIGLTGAANEQAAGLGKPVVAFTGTGPQTTKRRFEEQQRLMGDSLVFTEDFPEGAVKAVLHLLDNEAERTLRGKIGMERIGPPGGAERIARFVFDKYFGFGSGK
ncbi:MAG: hypothetical protein A2Y33_16120 [Spirochaetes bacterium GWF1_51_8]|nr:MAG: hypothetical protein A2Y33_16120 [Spirochaetes bacterium GWF1_51_8]